MYRTMLVSGNNDLLCELKNLHIWGEPSEFEISAVVRSGDEAYRELYRRRYDLVICETQTEGMDSLELLRRAKSEKLCGRIAFCSREADFEYARQGIILGAFDYFVSPFREIQFYSAFSRIKNKTNENKAVEIYRADEIINMFKSHDTTIHEYISDVADEVYSGAADNVSAENILREIYKTVVDEVFRLNPWLDLYKSCKSFYIPEISDMGYGSYKKYFKEMLSDLFREYCGLFPNVNNAKIQEVILYILNNPESDLKQKTIAAEFYINSSYLSTVFSAQTQLRFVDYLTSVKLRRAAWLLQNTTMKITEIAERLDYKDIGYFSRVFKRQYSVTPTEYRIPDNYNYEI